MDPNDPRFRGAFCDHLGDLADDVRPVDLHDRVLASSRRLAVRRTALATSALAAVVAVASGVAWAGLPGIGGPGRTPAGSESTAPAPTTVPPSSPPATVTPHPTGSATGEQPGLGGIAATLYYIRFDGGSEHLYGLTGHDVREVLSPRAPTCGMAVSPDGTRVAWATTDGGGSTGDLVVSGIDGKGQKTVRKDVSCTGGNAPFWTPDSRHMLVSRGNQADRALVDVETGALSATPLAKVHDHGVWSPNGRYVAYAKDGKIVVAKPDGMVVHQVAHGDETPTGGFTVQGVTDDGRRVVVGVRATDLHQIRSGHRLVDAVTGQAIELPGSVRPANPRQVAIYPWADGQLLVRVPQGSHHKLYLFGAGWQPRAEVVEPAALSSGTLLAPSSP